MKPITDASVPAGKKKQDFNLTGMASKSAWTDATDTEVTPAGEIDDPVVLESTR